MKARKVIIIMAAFVAPSAMAGTVFADRTNEHRTQWRLVHEETFDQPLDDQRLASWFRDDPCEKAGYRVDESYDDCGRFFETMGGPGFRQQLAKFHLYRKSFAFGEDGWLTAELAARDTDSDGRPDNPPQLLRDVLPGVGPVAQLDEPNHQGGVVIRATRPLPKNYRVEMTLRTINFGGQRDGSWHYSDGRINGYSPQGCKTNFPWASNGDFSRPECEWDDMRAGKSGANGFYFLGIMDYPAAPHNNVLIHTHRKVAIDAYNRYQYTGDGLRYCDPATKQYESYGKGTGNGVNMIFMTSERRYQNQPGTEYLMHSECGVAKGGAIVSQVDLRPELMPEQSYRFAIERTDDGYTMEISGAFAHVGQATYRYSQKFTPDDGDCSETIWHYNQTPEEYDGRCDATWTWEGPGGKLVDENTWPADSSYPDYFMIGDPHLNFYEGKAHIDDIKLYVPKTE